MTEKIFGPHKRRGASIVWAEEEVKELIEDMWIEAEKDDCYSMLVLRSQVGVNYDQMREIWKRLPELKRSYDEISEFIGARRLKGVMKNGENHQLYSKQEWIFDKQVRRREDKKDITANGGTPAELAQAAKEMSDKSKALDQKLAEANELLARLKSTNDDD